MRITRQLTASAIVCLLALPGLAQQAPGGQQLRIIPLEGQNAVNIIPLRTAVAPIVEVRDENDRPVEGASVVFSLPESGPGATFEAGGRTQTAITDHRGQAGATGYTINSTVGRFLINVTASYQGRSGRLAMTQTNAMQAVVEKQGGGKLKWVILGIAAAAGAGAGVYYGTRNSNTPISVGVGPISVGGPQ